jgi:hypothetical protein
MDQAAHPAGWPAQAPPTGFRVGDQIGAEPRLAAELSRWVTSSGVGNQFPLGLGRLVRWTRSACRRLLRRWRFW